jgi:hypothetical protein
MGIKLISSTTKNYYLVGVDSILYSYMEEIGDGGNLLDYHIKLSSTVDDTMAAREVTDQSIRNKVLAIVTDFEKKLPKSYLHVKKYYLNNK